MENFSTIDGAANERIRLLEAELARSRMREHDLADFIENAAMGLHWVGSDGVILWANQAELDLLGYMREEYVGRNIREFHADPPVIADIFDRLSNKETLTNYEARLRCKDGSLRYVLITSNVRWNQGEFIHTRCFTRDVTYQKRYEQRLLAQSGVGNILSHAASLAEAAPQMLKLIGECLGWCCGMVWTLCDGELRCLAAWEAADAAVCGFTASCEGVTFVPGLGLPGRIVAAKASHWVVDLRLDDNFPRLALASAKGLRSAFGFPIMTGDIACGAVEFLSTDVRSPDKELLGLAEALGYQIGEFVERTRAQQELAEREESYRVLTETASDGIVTVDAASGAIAFVNQPAAAIFGYARVELPGMQATALMPAFAASAAAHTRAGAVAMAGQHRHGHEVPLEVSFGEYRQGSIHTLVCVIRDVTDRKRLDDKVRQTAKLESLGVLAGGVAHDFNNLLTGIMGNVSLAAEMVAGDAEAKAVLEDAGQAAERAAHLTRQMLAYAGKGRFVVEAVDVSELVRQISILVKSSIPRNVTVRLDLEPALPLVEADAAQLQQLVMNLVINGAEAIPPERQGRVLVTTRLRDMDAAAIAETFKDNELAPGKYIVMSIHDNGSGMDDATMTKIFDPFFTTKFTGRGLGLAATQGIVRGHKGALKVFSTPGEGTTFRVYLPATGAVKKALAPKVAQPQLVGSGTVLVVDDELVIRKIATASLKRYGYTTLIAENGREGVEVFRESHGDLSMVLLDLTMPVMDGEEALRQMRAIDPAVPVVLSSGFNELEAVRRFDGKGLAGFIQKPYTAAALAEKVRSIVCKR